MRCGFHWCSGGLDCRRREEEFVCLGMCHKVIDSHIRVHYYDGWRIFITVWCNTLIRNNQSGHVSLWVSRDLWFGMMLGCETRDWLGNYDFFNIKLYLPCATWETKSDFSRFMAIYWKQYECVWCGAIKVDVLSQVICKCKIVGLQILLLLGEVYK